MVWAERRDWKRVSEWGGGAKTRLVVGGGVGKGQVRNAGVRCSQCWCPRGLL